MIDYRLMPAFAIHERLIPYRILAYLLYADSSQFEWLDSLETEGGIRIYTGPASRQFRLKNAHFWEALRWLRDQGLIKFNERQEKRGVLDITLLQPRNI